MATIIRENTGSEPPFNSVADEIADAQIPNRFGKVTATRIEVKVTVSGSNGAAIVTDVAGMDADASAICGARAS